MIYMYYILDYGWKYINIEHLLNKLETIKEAQYIDNVLCIWYWVNWLVISLFNCISDVGYLLVLTKLGRICGSQLWPLKLKSLSVYVSTSANTLIRCQCICHIQCFMMINRNKCNLTDISCFANYVLLQNIQFKQHHLKLIGKQNSW